MSTTITTVSVLLMLNTAGGVPIVFEKPMDAMSVRFETPEGTAEMRAELPDGTWTQWRELAVEIEFDPILRESNLIVFAEPVSRLEFRNATEHFETHPIRISREPPVFLVSSRGTALQHRILSRNEWGADESLLIQGAPTERSDVITAEPPSEKAQGEESPVAQRILDCKRWQEEFPEDFRRARIMRTDPRGQPLRWPLEYSPEVKLLVVHHTALAVGGDERSPVERVRALYQYHAQNRGWGDIGYHFLIDEEGQIYEGRAGGDYVIGGHVYCGNVGTIGIALLGNFEIEKPSQVQMQSLQWLLDTLAKQYDIDPARSVTYHGMKFNPIVGHRELVSTDCPGYYVFETLNQVRSHVRSGNLTAFIRFPRPIIQKEAKEIQEPKAGRKKEMKEEDRLARIKRKIRRYERLMPRSHPPPSRLRRAGRSQTRERSQRSQKILTPLLRIRIRPTTQEKELESCEQVDLDSLRARYRGTIECLEIEGRPALINELPLEEYLLGVAEEPDSEPFEKQKAFAVAARTYAAHYLDQKNRKFPGMPYDGADDPSVFQAYQGKTFETANPQWIKAVQETRGLVLTKDGEVIRAAYFSSDDGRTRSPEELGWKSFPFAEIFRSKHDPWCEGQPLTGHGVGMSGCGARGQAEEGKSAEEILNYYYPGALLDSLYEK